MTQPNKGHGDARPVASEIGQSFISNRNYESHKRNHSKNPKSLFVSNSNFRIVIIFGQGIQTYGSRRKTLSKSSLPATGRASPWELKNLNVREELYRILSSRK